MRSSRLGLLVLLWAVVAGCGGDDAAPRAGDDAINADAVQERAALYETLREAGRARRSGDLDEEVRLLRRALEIDCDHEGCLVDLAHALRRQGRRAESLETLARLRAVRPDLPRPHFLMAELLAEPADAPAEDLQRALSLYARALEIEPNVSGPRLALARTQQRLGLQAEAEGSYRTVLGTNPDSVEALRGLAALLADRQAYAEAVPLLVHALEVGTRAKGRADVPSEMDTAASFDAASLEAEPNRSLRAALAESARALGGYPQEVPERFRLPLR